MLARYVFQLIYSIFLLTISFPKKAKLWLYNNARRKKPFVKYGKKWSTHQVLQAQQEASIKEKAVELSGEAPGGSKFIGTYQKSTAKYMENMDEHQLEVLKQTADMWNTEAPPRDVQLKLVNTY
jgi:hypothetical protein